MRLLGHNKEAYFCKLVRDWYSADDAPGISAVNRAAYRLNMRKFLLDPLDFGQFPPYGSHVLGMSKQMLEGFLQSIDTNIQLYSVVIDGTMNSRAVSSLTNETFFGDMTDMEQS